MTVATEIITLQDLLDDLGGIAAARVLLKPAPGDATEADLIAVNDSRRTLCELVDGALVEKGLGIRKSVLCVAISAELYNFERPRNLGIVVGPSAMIRLAPGLIRAADVSYISWNRLPGGVIPREPIPTLAPELVVEVLSANNTKREMERKRREYFSVGVEVVWEIDFEPRTARVYRRGEAAATAFDQTGILEAADLLPGFQLPLAELFAELDRTGDPR